MFLDFLVCFGFVLDYFVPLFFKIWVCSLILWVCSSFLWVCSSIFGMLLMIWSFFFCYFKVWLCSSLFCVLVLQNLGVCSSKFGFVFEFLLIFSFVCSTSGFLVDVIFFFWLQDLCLFLIILWV